MSDPTKTTPDSEESLPDSEEFAISVRKEELVHFDITLSLEVDFSFRYEKLFAFLRNLPLNTASVNLYLANYGGYIQGLIPLFNAFKYCVVPVDVHVTGDCYSAGACLALSGRSLTMYPNTLLMFHNSTGGNFGKGKELYDAVVHSTKHQQRMFRQMLSPFLTKEEVDNLLNDKDVYVHWDDKDLQDRKTRLFDPPKKVRRSKTNE